ncbi:unnamed protein product, partial [Discosporangium mesarthrocarpum]
DLGLLIFRLHPEWPSIPYAYFLATMDNGYNDECTLDGLFCEKYNVLSRVVVAYDHEKESVACAGRDTLIKDWCSGSNHHGGGGMDFTADGDMILAVGDMSKVCHLV